MLTRDGTNPLSSDALADQDFAADEALPQRRYPPPPQVRSTTTFWWHAGGLRVHNPLYVGQILYDSIEAVAGNLTGLTRPN